MGLRHNVPAQLAAAQFAAAEKARLTILAVGSPQQELLARLIALQADATGIGLCVGAALDFITGTERRAPLAFQKLGLEWFFRLASDPRRLWRRYLVEGPKIFALWWRAGHH
jgi:exopolysaccharide biosynthesis WecB/TagA/CpsF family protein